MNLSLNNNGYTQNTTITKLEKEVNHEQSNFSPPINTVDTSSKKIFKCSTTTPIKVRCIRIYMDVTR